MFTPHQHTIKRVVRPRLRRNCRRTRSFVSQVRPKIRTLCDMADVAMQRCCFGRLNLMPPSMNWQEQSVAGHEDPDWLILAVGWEQLHSCDCKVTLGQAFPLDSWLTLPRSAPRCPTFT